jgi:hypothetical protein
MNFSFVVVFKTTWRIHLRSKIGTAHPLATPLTTPASLGRATSGSMEEPSTTEGAAIGDAETNGCAKHLELLKKPGLTARTSQGMLLLWNENLLWGSARRALRVFDVTFAL